MWNKTAETQNSSDPCLPARTETLKLCRSAVVYCWFPLQQMIKTCRSEREVPCVSVFLCIISSVACQYNGADKNRDNIAPEFALNVFWSSTKWDFFDTQSHLLSASTEAVRRSQSSFHSTQSKTAYLLSNHTVTLQLQTLLSSFQIKEEITQESCCGLSWGTIIRRSELLQILIKLWQLICLKVILDSIQLNERQSLTKTAESCIIYKFNLKHKPAMVEHTVLCMSINLLRNRMWFPLSYLPVQEVFVVILRDMVQGASINLYWPLSGFQEPQYAQCNAP